MGVEILLIDENRMIIVCPKDLILENQDALLELEELLGDIRTADSEEQQAEQDTPEPEEIPEPSCYIVPNLSGVKYSLAGGKLREAGLRLKGPEWSCFDDAKSNAIIVGQYPPPGSCWPADTIIQMQVNRCVQPDPTKCKIIPAEIIGMPYIEADDLVKDLGFTFGRASDVCQSDEPNGVVVNVAPSPGKCLDPAVTHLMITVNWCK